MNQFICVLWYWFELKGFRKPCAIIYQEFEFRALHALSHKSGDANLCVTAFIYALLLNQNKQIFEF